MRFSCDELTVVTIGSWLFCNRCTVGMFMCCVCVCECVVFVNVYLFVFVDVFVLCMLCVAYVNVLCL